MAYEESLVCITRPAGADLTGDIYHVVKLDSSGDVVLAQLGDVEAIGVLQNNPDDTQAATVAISGLTKVHASAAVTAGSQVGVGATDGQVLDAVSTHVSIGTATVAAASANDYAVVSINIGDAALA